MGTIGGKEALPTLRNESTELDNGEESEETKKENHTNTVSGIAAGANASRPKNLRSLEKVDIKK